MFYDESISRAERERVVVVEQNPVTQGVRGANESSLERFSSFTIPHDGESVHSLLSRHYQLCHAPNRKLYLQRLMGVTKFRLRTINFSWAVQEAVFAKVPPLYEDREEFLTRHSVIPFYRPFGVCANSGPSSLHGTTDFRKSLQAFTIRRPRFCPQCVREAASRHGMPVWRRAHQIRGVIVCDVHGERLVDQCQRCCRLVAPDYKLELPPERCCDSAFGDDRSPAPPEGAMLYAKFAEDLCRKNLPVLDPRHIVAGVRCEARRQGIERADDLPSALCEFLGEELLLDIESTRSTRGVGVWAANAFRWQWLAGMAPRRVATLTFFFRDVEAFVRAVARARDDPTSEERAELERALERPPKRPARKGSSAVSRITRQTAVDEERDRQYAEALSRTVHRFRSQPGRPIFLAPTRILREAGITLRASRIRELYPLAWSILAKESETAEGFKKRALVWASEELVQSGSALSAWALCDKARVTYAGRNKELAAQVLSQVESDMRTGSHPHPR